MGAFFSSIEPIASLPAHSSANSLPGTVARTLNLGEACSNDVIPLDGVGCSFDRHKLTVAESKVLSLSSDKKKLEKQLLDMSDEKGRATAEKEELVRDNKHLADQLKEQVAVNGSHIESKRKAEAELETERGLKRKAEDDLKSQGTVLKRMKTEKAVTDLALEWADSFVNEMSEVAVAELGSGEKFPLFMYAVFRMLGALVDAGDPSKGFHGDVSHVVGAYLQAKDEPMNERIAHLEAVFQTIELPDGVEKSAAAYWDCIRKMP